MNLDRWPTYRGFSIKKYNFYKYGEKKLTSFQKSLLLALRLTVLVP